MGVNMSSGVNLKKFAISLATALAASSSTAAPLNSAPDSPVFGHAPQSGALPAGAKDSIFRTAAECRQNWADAARTGDCGNQTRQDAALGKHPNPVFEANIHSPKR